MDTRIIRRALFTGIIAGLLALSGCGSSTGMSQAQQTADSNLCAETPVISGVAAQDPDLTPALAALVQQWETINYQPITYESDGTTPIVPPQFTADLGKIEAWCIAHGFVAYNGVGS